MGKRQFTFFLLLALVLGGLYFTLDSSQSRGGAPREVHLFDGVNGEAISRIIIEQGKDKIELAAKDGTWTIPTRGGFPADTTKIRSLLLKVFDLSVSQQVPLVEGTDLEPKYERLGVSDASIEKGQTKISFLDAEGKSIAGLRLGVPSQSKRSAAMKPGGQYLRRDGQRAVFLSPTSIDVAPKVASWLLGDIVTVLQTALLDVVQSKVAAGAAEKQFALERASLDEAVLGKPQDFEFKGTVPAGKQLDSTGVSQISGALENLRALDVWPKDAADVKDLSFDFETTYRTHSGLIYTVRTAQKGDQSYATVRVKFDPEIVTMVKAAYDRALEKRAATPAASPVSSPSPAASAEPSAQPSPGASVSPTAISTAGVSTAGAAATTSPSAAPSPSPSPTPEPPKVSSKEEAEKLNAKFEPWVYQIPSYQGTAFRKSLETIAIDPPKTALGNTGSGAAKPSALAGMMGGSGMTMPEMPAEDDAGE